MARFTYTVSEMWYKKYCEQYSCLKFSRSFKKPCSVSLAMTEPEFLNLKGAQESISGKKFRQPIYVACRHGGAVG
jgi:hypothetical protein